MPAPAPDRGLEGEPPLGSLSALKQEAPHVGQPRLQHVGDGAAALEGDDVPGEEPRVAPVARLVEQGGGIGIAALERRREFARAQLSISFIVYPQRWSCCRHSRLSRTDCRTPDGNRVLQCVPRADFEIGKLSRNDAAEGRSFAIGKSMLIEKPRIGGKIAGRALHPLLRSFAVGYFLAAGSAATWSIRRPASSCPRARTGVRVDHRMAAAGAGPASWPGWRAIVALDRPSGRASASATCPTSGCMPRAARWSWRWNSTTSHPPVGRRRRHHAHGADPVAFRDRRPAGDARREPGPGCIAKPHSASGRGWQELARRFGGDDRPSEDRAHEIRRHLRRWPCRSDLAAARPVHQPTPRRRSRTACPM
mgnify:CR=1 FL=1